MCLKSDHGNTKEAGLSPCQLTVSARKGDPYLLPDGPEGRRGPSLYPMSRLLHWHATPTP